MVRLVLALTVMLSGCTTSSAPDSDETGTQGRPPRSTSANCPVTEPSPADTYPTQIAGTQEREWYGSDGLWVDLHNFALAAVPGQDGLRVKHAWWTGDDSGGASDRSGPPELHATRLDGSDDADGSVGGYARADGLAWWPAVLTFPTPGCWRVTGEVDDRTLQFVVRIVPQSERATGGP